MILLLGALLIGVIAGLRAMTAPAAVAWAIHLGCVAAPGDWTAFMGYRFTPWIFGLLALAELVTDQLPSTPSRKVPVQFATRIIMGGLAGATLCSAAGMTLAGLAAGAVGAVIGTLGGAAGRAQLAARFGRDLPAALIEDALAILGAFLIICVLR
ncbi:membrane protein [Sphingomonas sp. DBB INV C78]|uniref:DUF4126 domain-containing protein n=1 Tax=Sphingomonas sp. DBB INV C78 TaxID=3349434 RepID=UPI0036D38F6E